LKTKEGAEDEEMEEDDGSIPSGFDKGEDYMTEIEMTEEAFAITWDCSLSQVGGPTGHQPCRLTARPSIYLDLY
jgi:hypothetical protein